MKAEAANRARDIQALLAGQTVICHGKSLSYLVLLAAEMNVDPSDLLIVSDHASGCAALRLKF